MEKISIFKAISNVELNTMSTIYSKQDLINLLNSIDADQTIENSDAQFYKNKFDDLTKMYNQCNAMLIQSQVDNVDLKFAVNDLKKEIETITLNDPNLALYHSEMEKSYEMECRLNNLKQSMWHYFVNPNEDFNCNSENDNDQTFADNIRISNVNGRNDYLNDAIEMYKSNNNLVDWDLLYQNFKDRVYNFEFEDICSSCDFDIVHGNEITISNADINTINIIDELEYAYENVK